MFVYAWQKFVNHHQTKINTMKLVKKKVPKKKTVTKAAAIQETVSKADIHALITMVNKQLGEGTLVLANEANLDIRWTSTTCYAIDFATGGGIPESRITEIYGVESSGKTTLSLKTINSFLTKYQMGIAVFIDVEKALEKKYLNALITAENRERLLLANPDSGEQVINIMNMTSDQPVPMLIVLDSIAATTPTVEVDQSAEKQQVGLHPRLINKMMRIATARMKRNMQDPDSPTTTVIVLNQTREMVGVMFGSPETTPGGKGKNFAAGLRLRLFGSATKSNQITQDKTIGNQQQKKLIGRKFTFSVVKNKCGVEPFEAGEFIYYNSGPDKFSYNNMEHLFKWGVLTEIISYTKKDGYWYMTEDETEISAKSETGFIKKLTQMDEADLTYLYDEVMEARVNGNFVSGEVVDDDED